MVRRIDKTYAMDSFVYHSDSVGGHLCIVYRCSVLVAETKTVDGGKYRFAGDKRRFERLVVLGILYS